MKFDLHNLIYETLENVTDIRFAWTIKLNRYGDAGIDDYEKQADYKLQLEKLS